MKSNKDIFINNFYNYYLSNVYSHKNAIQIYNEWVKTSSITPTWRSAKQLFDFILSL